MKYLVLLLLLIWLTPIAFGQHRPADVEQRIKQVENGLKPAVQLVDKPVIAYSIAERMAHYHVPAVSIAVVNNDTIEWAKAYGYLSSDSTQKADTQTLFQAASISKPISALGALKLVEQGKLALDTDVNQYLKSWKIKPSRFTAQKPVTLRGLLTHTAGLTVHGFGGYVIGKPVPTLVQILNGEKPANSPAVVSDTMPGARWKYSGGGYVILQQMMEDVTGQSFSDFMQRTVLIPVGMSRSTFQQPLPEALLANATVGHYSNGRRITGGRNTYPEQAPAGLWTTPTDLARYVLSVQQSLRGTNKLVLSKTMTEQMLTKHMGDHGLGPGVSGEGDKTAFGHGGGNAGYRCFLYAFAHSGQGAVIMTNADSGMELSNELLRSLSTTYGWPTYKATVKKLTSLTPEQLTKLAGRYVGYGDRKPVLDVSVNDNGLRVKQSWDGYVYTLLPESERSFFLEDDGAPFTFELAADGTIASLLAFGEDRWTKLK